MKEIDRTERITAQVSRTVSLHLPAVLFFICRNKTVNCCPLPELLEVKLMVDLPRTLVRTLGASGVAAGHCGRPFVCFCAGRLGLTRS